MLALTHLILAILLIRIFKLDRVEAFAVLLFGVFIDIDHALGMVGFIGRVGWENVLNLDAAMSSGVQWKSLIHSPEGALFVVPVVVGFRFFVPAIAWGLHLTMDYVQMEYLGIASVFEIVLLAAMLLFLLHLENKAYREAGHKAGLRGLMEWEGERLSAMAKEAPVLRSISMWIGPRGTSG